MEIAPIWTSVPIYESLMAKLLDKSIEERALGSHYDSISAKDQITSLHKEASVVWGTMLKSESLVILSDSLIRELMSKYVELKKQGLLDRPFILALALETLVDCFYGLDPDMYKWERNPLIRSQVPNYLKSAIDTYVSMSFPSKLGLDRFTTFTKYQSAFVAKHPSNFPQSLIYTHLANLYVVPDSAILGLVIDNGFPNFSFDSDTNLRTHERGLITNAYVQILTVFDYNFSADLYTSDVELVKDYIERLWFVLKEVMKGSFAIKGL